MLDIDVRKDVDDVDNALYLNDMERCVGILLDDLVDYDYIDDSTIENIRFDMSDQENDEFDEQSKMNFLGDYVDDFVQEIKEGEY